jgi:type VI secretion system secreted protein VgrG
MAGHDTRTVLELRAGDVGADELAVRRVRGRERLSEPYAFDVEFSHRDGTVLALADLVGAEAALTLRRPGGAERHVHGMLLRVELAGVAAGAPTYRARLVPRLERLRLVTRSRVFQAQSAPDVVKKVLDEAGVECRLSLSATHAVREYCVQYRESDLQFVSRLLEDEGIFYYFEHGPDSHVLVLADANGACAELEGGAAVPFRLVARAGDEEEEEHLSHLERAHGARTGKVALSDFDFERPSAPATGAADSSDPLGLEWYEHPAGATQPSAVAARSRLRLEELRFGVETFAGGGNCLLFVPGATFEVQGHPDPDFERTLLLVEVTHEAVQQESAGDAEAVAHGYRSSFLALDPAVPYRPRRRAARPAAVAETATIVGPAGEEVHVDRLGRVKVQFHWDREGRRDDRSSCFVRLAQAWAGPAWGASLVPRIGQEVLVRFMGGDPDRPLVAGAIYNGANPPPILLPDEKTRSTTRSDSSPGGGGSNELLFEDQTFAEAVSLHAQKDMRVEVLNDARRRIGANAAESIGKDRRQQIKGNHVLAVTETDEARVTGNQTLAVTGSRTTAVGATHEEQVVLQQSVTVGGNQDVRADAAAVETIGAGAALNVGAVYAVNVAGVLNEAVGGLKSGQVAGARVEIVGAARSENVVGDAKFDVGGDFLTEARANVALDTSGDQEEKIGGATEVESKEPAQIAAKEIELEGTDRLAFVVDGKEVLSFASSGNVAFGVAGLSVDGSSLAMKGSQVKKVAAGSAASAQAQVTQIKPAPEDKAFVEIEVLDQDGNPAVNEWFRVEFPDGTVREGKLDGNGHAWVPGPKEGSCKLTFPKLDKKAW